MSTLTFDPIALFRRSATARPDSPALAVNDRTYTYGELDRWSDNIAEAITAMDPPPRRCAFVAQREAESYALVLGILKAGCSYVPLHPAGPEGRWRSMIEKCGAHVLSARDLFAEATTASLVDAERTRDEDGEAYVLFTSGSTGGPKGVSVSRSNVAAYLEHVLGTYDLRSTDRFTQHFALTFDLSVHDLFVCWGAGGCLVVPKEDGGLRAATFAREQGITIWFSVPSLISLLDRMRALGPESLPALRYAFFCGEALSFDQARAFARAATSCRIVDLYGPTETTIAVTSFEPDVENGSGIVPIGLPFPALEAMIMEEELCITGPQVSNGYVNDKEANARAFVRFAGDERTWYRTGDRVRKDEQGILHYLGRLDDQVKVAGHRVEPGEVDTVLMPLLQGGRSVTVPVQRHGGTHLTTFIDVTIKIEPLLAACRAALPSYMVPERILPIDRWPLTSHGKTDRRALIDHAQDA